MYKKLNDARFAFLLVLVAILSSCFTSCNSDDEAELLISIIDSYGERIEGEVYILHDGTYSDYANGVFSGNFSSIKVGDTDYLRYSCEPGNYLIIATSILSSGSVEAQELRGHIEVTAIRDEPVIAVITVE